MYSDYSHEIKRYLLLGRKAKANLDSILKSRDITLQTKVHLVKAMVFPVVMYRYDSWNIKLNTKELMMRVPWTARRSSKSILKEINPVYSLEGPMLRLKLQSFGHLMGRANSLEKIQMLGRLKTKGKGGCRG